MKVIHVHRKFGKSIKIESTGILFLYHLYAFISPIICSSMNFFFNILIYLFIFKDSNPWGRKPHAVGWGQDLESTTLRLTLIAMSWLFTLDNNFEPTVGIVKRSRNTEHHTRIVEDDICRTPSEVQTNPGEQQMLPFWPMTTLARPFSQFL